MKKAMKLTTSTIVFNKIKITKAKTLDDSNL
jgi:hypothetical protein